MTQSVNRDEFDPAQLVPVAIVWDPILGSPPELESYGGAVVLVPPTYIPLPNRGTLYNVRGYSRQNVEGGWEWVLLGDNEPIPQFVDSLTGRGKWEDQTARATVISMVEALYSAGIPADTIATQFPLLVQAIVAEVLAVQALPPAMQGAMTGRAQGEPVDAEE